MDDDGGIQSYQTRQQYEEQDHFIKPINSTGSKTVTMTKEETAKPTGIALLREPFPAHLISKLPKPFKKDSPKGQCRECGGYHALPAAHLDYVGHAALTGRLLDADPNWSWEPLSFDASGLPMLDRDGGMWIKLTVCGVTRLGYGDAQGKSGGNAAKERIGDALRNAAMRFGAALDLWHKGDWHDDDEDPRPPVRGEPPRAESPRAESPRAEPATTMPENTLLDYLASIDGAETIEELEKVFISAQTSAHKHNDGEAYRKIVKATNARKAKLTAEETPS